jgi:hypothetical protein
MMLDRQRPAGTDNTSRTGLVASALAVILVVRGTEKLAQWLIDFSSATHTALAGEDETRGGAPPPGAIRRRQDHRT